MPGFHFNTRAKEALHSRQVVFQMAEVAVPREQASFTKKRRFGTLK